MSWFDRLRLALTWPEWRKGAALPVVAPWVSATFFDLDFHNLVSEGYKKNSAFFACLSALAFAFIEPALKVYDAEGQELSKHNTRLLILRPNDLMGEKELWLYTIVYAGIGGNAYWHKVRNSNGRVIALKPYHATTIQPVPGRGDSWIERYDFDDGMGHKTPIDKADVVHFKWPSPDPHQPWIAQPPLLAAAREVDTDNEATRYLKAILQNDAIPRLVMYVPPESNLDLDNQEKVNRYKAQFKAKYGGDNRGELAILTGGAKIERVSLNLEELAFEALHRIPETRIAAAMRVPPIVAGLNVGLERSTYSNYGEAISHFTRGTLAPLWELMASEINADADLNPGGGNTIRFDLSQVKALQENEDNRWARYTAALNAGGITINDFLRGVGLQPVQFGDIRLVDSNKVAMNLEKNIFTPVALPQSKGVKQLEVGRHSGEFMALLCPVCGQTGATKYADHKGLCVCTHCACTFDPAVEAVL